jgi:HAE1 family hydrophobic/amphiphilic exporter-1
LSVVNEYAETQLAQRLSTIAGVAQVQCLRFAEVRRAHPGRPRPARSRGIGIDELQQAVSQANVNQPIGNLDGHRQSFAIRANGQLNAAAYRPLIVAWRNGAPVRLEEVARSVDSVETTSASPAGTWTGSGRHHPGRAAPARRQHHRDRRAHQGRCCPPSSPGCRRRSS